MPSYSAWPRAVVSGLSTISRKPLAMPCRPSSANRSIVGCLSKIRLLMVVAGAADVVVQQRRAVRGARRRCLVEPVLEDRGDRGVGQRADLDGAQADRLGPGGIDAAEQPQHAETGTEALFGMRPASQHGD